MPLNQQENDAIVMSASRLILMAGLPGTGKTTLATALVGRLMVGTAVLLNKDVIRAALFPTDRVEYSTRQDDFVLSIMLQTADYLFTAQSANSVILDGRTFSRRHQIEECAAFIEQKGATLRIIECVCSEETARKRLEYETRVHLAANRDFALHQEIKARFELITRSKLIVDTDQPIEVCVERCVHYLEAI